MFEKFGEFDSYEEINRAAKAQLEEGDLEAIKTIAEENGLDPEDAEDFCTGAIEELTTPSLAAMGKLELEAGKTQEIQSDFIRAGQHKEENCTSAMPEPVEIVEKPVDNSEQMEENARNTEAGANSEPVDKSEEEQNPAGSRWEYMKTMESYKMALYMAASVKEMPHMMLNSAEYWKKWLEAEVDENGEELSKK